MNTSEGISGIPPSRVVQDLPKRKRERDRDKRDEHFERQMKDIEDEEGRIRDHVDISHPKRDQDQPDPDEQPQPEQADKPPPKDDEDQDGRRHIDVKA